MLLLQYGRPVHVISPYSRTSRAVLWGAADTYGYSATVRGFPFLGATIMSAVLSSPVLVYCCEMPLQELRAAQKARALLNLPDPLHCRALALLFTPGSPYCLLDSEGSAAPGSTAAATAVSSSSSSTSSVLGIPASLTLRELSRFYLAYSDSSAWSSICEIWQVAVDAMCLHLARAEGLLAPEQPTGAIGGAAGPVPAAAEQQFAFSFEALLTGRVAGLVRKPVRLCFGLNKLLLGLDAAAGLSAARDYCERAAREFAEQAKG